MSLSPETIAGINRRAQQINNEHDRKIAKNELAKVRFEAHKTKIGQGLSDFNQQLAGNPKLQKDLSVILRKKENYKTYHEVEVLGSCIGLEIARTSGQIAVMTETGIQVLESRWRGIYHTFGHSQKEVFTPLKLEEANVCDLFPKTKFAVDELPETIIKIVLQSPNKK